jgi:hypothetical protein
VHNEDFSAKLAQRSDGNILAERIAVPRQERVAVEGMFRLEHRGQKKLCVMFLPEHSYPIQVPLNE